MNHANVKKNLADYLEGDLDLSKRAIVDAHLDQCEECALEVSEMEQTIRLLRTLPEPETPPMMSANVMRKIRAGETEPGFLTRLGRRVAAIFEPSFMLPASAIAAAALVVVVVQDRAPGLSGGLVESGTSELGEAVPAWAIRDSNKVATLTAMAPGPGLAARLGNAGGDVHGDVRGDVRRNADRVARSVSVAASPMNPSRVIDSERFALGASRSTGGGLAGGAPPPFFVQAESLPGTLEGASRGSASQGPIAADRIVIRSRLAGVDAQRSRLGAPTDFGAANGRSAANGFASISGLSDSSGLNGAGGGNGLSGAMPVAGPISQQVLSSLRAQPVRAAVPLASPTTAKLAQGFPAGGSGDPRDAWLTTALDRPVDFARFLANKNLAEQELWVARLSDRAESRGLLDELVQALLETEDVAAGVLAADFLAARDASGSESAESSGNP